MIIAITVRTLALSRANAIIIGGKLYQDSEGDLRGPLHGDPDRSSVVPY